MKRAAFLLRGRLPGWKFQNVASELYVFVVQDFNVILVIHDTFCLTACCAQLTGAIIQTRGHAGGEEGGNGLLRATCEVNFACNQQK